jgi:hypothetical protein
MEGRGKILMKGREEEGRDFNYICVWFKSGKGREEMLTTYMFGSQRK